MRKFTLLFIAAAVVLPSGGFGHSYGPPPGVTAAPGDKANACTLCHASYALNSGSGSVTITLPGGPVYVPGVKQRVSVTVSDPNQKRWGFQLTARLNSNPQTGQAGDLTPVDNQTQIICPDNGPLPCASGADYIEHTSAGTRNGTTGGATFQFDWTPPATNAGPVTMYAAGNAANGDGTLNGDYIYTTSVQLTPVTPVAPTVTAGSVVSSATGTAVPVTANSWVTIYGSNLGTTTRSWAAGDIVDGGLPFSLDGVSVVLTQFGAPRLAYVAYVSPTQVNFVLPTDLVATSTTVAVRNPAGISSSIPLSVQANAPQVFTLDGTEVLATHANGTAVSKTSPAAPGETVSIFASGMGATAPAQVPGQVVTAPASLATAPQVSIGGTAASVSAAALLPGTVGVCQINIQVPANAANGDLPLVVQVGTATSASTTVITVQK